jgi:AmmeMemoRadiSam system protein A
VVGYGALALHEGEGVSRDEAGRTLLAVARGAIDAGLQKAVPPERGEGWLAQAGASFVTLTSAGSLRGCIGSLQALRPLGADVAANAAAAAFRDPRFAPLAAAEWLQCRVEVSLLSAPKPVRFADEADLLAQVRAGEDGIILEADGKRATFLPQVWEDIADKRTFFAHLMRKAGLPADTRLGRCSVSRYRVAKWKE